MAWLAVDKDGSERIYENIVKCPIEGVFIDYASNLKSHQRVNRRGVLLPKGTIIKLIGRELNWDNSPVKIE